MKLLAIDPGKHTLGYAVFDGGNLASVNTHSFSHCHDLNELLRAFRAWLQDELYGVNVLAYEDSSPRSKVHAEQYYGMVAIMHLYAPAGGLHAIHWTQGKKVLTGKGGASKQQVLEAAQFRYPELEITRYDEADAISIGLALTTQNA